MAPCLMIAFVDFRLDKRGLDRRALTGSERSISAERDEQRGGIMPLSIISGDLSTDFSSVGTISARTSS